MDGVGRSEGVEVVELEQPGDCAVRADSDVEAKADGAALLAALDQGVGR